MKKQRSIGFLFWVFCLVPFLSLAAFAQQSRERVTAPDFSGIFPTVPGCILKVDPIYDAGKYKIFTVVYTKEQPKFDAGNAGSVIVLPESPMETFETNECGRISVKFFSKLKNQKKRGLMFKEHTKTRRTFFYVNVGWRKKLPFPNLEAYRYFPPCDTAPCPSDFWEDIEVYFGQNKLLMVNTYFRYKVIADFARNAVYALIETKVNQFLQQKN